MPHSDAPNRQRSGLAQFNGRGNPRAGARSDKSDPSGFVAETLITVVSLARPDESDPLDEPTWLTEDFTPRRKRGM